MSDTWVILASGESLKPVKVNCNVMTINSSWQACPTANVHYSNDYDWYSRELPKMRKECTGRFMCGHPEKMVRGTDQSYKFDKGYRGICMEPGRIAWGGNSGYAGINLAIQLGAKRVILLGYDMCGKSHWHGEHHKSVRKPFNFPMWIQRFDEMARDAKLMGVEIINCSPISALKCFPKMSIDEVEL